MCWELKHIFTQFLILGKENIYGNSAVQKLLKCECGFNFYFAVNHCFLYNV